MQSNARNKLEIIGRQVLNQILNKKKKKSLILDEKFTRINDRSI
jgi:hypothetical protein